MEMEMETTMVLHKFSLDFTSSATPEYWLTVIYCSDNKHFSPDFAQNLHIFFLKLSKTFQVWESERID